MSKYVSLNIANPTQGSGAESTGGINNLTADSCIMPTLSLNNQMTPVLGFLGANAQMGSQLGTVPLCYRPYPGVGMIADTITDPITPVVKGFTEDAFDTLDVVDNIYNGATGAAKYDFEIHPVVLHIAIDGYMGNFIAWMAGRFSVKEADRTVSIRAAEFAQNCVGTTVLQTGVKMGQSKSWEEVIAVYLAKEYVELKTLSGTTPPTLSTHKYTSVSLYQYYPFYVEI